MNVLVGPPGSGKSHYMRQRAISTPGLYLVAVPTTSLANEQHDDYYAAASGCPPLFSVHSRSGMPGTVARQFVDVQAEIETRGLRHAVVFITHESLLTLDLSGITQWHVMIDEVPHAVRSGKFFVSLSADYFSARYDLQPLEAGWSVVTPKDAPTPWRARESDALASGVAEFDQEAHRQHGLIVNLESWTQVAERAVAWLSIWTPAALSHCASVTIAGAGFFTSLAYLVAERLHPHVAFEKVSVHQRPRSALPTLRLHYFVQGHRGSTTFWKTREGRLVLHPIRLFLADLPDLGFWSGNDVIEQQFDTVLPLSGLVRPKVAGTNRYAEFRSCAFIYSAQAVPDDEPLGLFGVDKREIERSREFEDLYQFIMRGRLRNPTFGGVFDAYVYSQDQAVEIAGRAEQDGIALTELVPHPEVGVMDIVRGKAKRSAKPDEAEERRQARLAKDRKRKRNERAARAQAAGRTGQPGRPKKCEAPASP